MGYVGVPLALEFVRAGLHVTGIDPNTERIQALRSGRSYLTDVSSEDLAQALRTERFLPSSDFSALAEADAVCICVPTPLCKSRGPDISYIVAAVEQVKRYLHPGMLVALESTTYPGTTEEVVLPILSQSGLRVGTDFFLVFSPERTDPGNKIWRVKNTPKVLGGITPACTERGIAFYRRVVDTVVPVSSTRCAETVKLLENMFRAVNIALVNEFALMCERLNVDVWEVIEAAKTKPFGFMPFYPGPGLGGHCIPVDPLYLSWKLKTLNYDARFIELATAVNASMPFYVVERIGRALNEVQKSINGSRILILGVTYKADVNDTRESPAVDIIRELKARGATVAYADPYVPRLDDFDPPLTAYPLAEGVESFDLVAIITAHSQVNYQEIVERASLVFDSRNVTRTCKIPPGCRIIRL